MDALALELFLAGFVAPLSVLLLILVVARRLRRRQEARSRLVTPAHRKSVGFNSDAARDLTDDAP